MRLATRPALSPARQTTARRPFGHRTRRQQLVVQESAQADEANCKECEELLERHRHCLSACCYAVSIAAMICLFTLVWVYVSRQSHNLTLQTADLASEMPADSMDCFFADAGGGVDYSDEDSELRQTADSARSNCAHLLPPAASSDATGGGHPPLLRLQRIDGTLLAATAGPSVTLVQGPPSPSQLSGGYDACGPPAPASASGSEACGNLTLTRLRGCPLVHFLYSDIGLRLRLALSLLRLAEALDSARPPVQLSSSAQLDDFGVERNGRVVLINPNRLRAPSERQMEDPACPNGHLANYATVSGLLHDAYTYISEARSPPSLGRSFLRGWSDWRFSRQMGPIAPQMRPSVWDGLDARDRQADREGLLKDIEASLHGDDPVLGNLWWCICALSIASLVFALFRYWLCFKLILCLEYMCL